MRTSFTGLFGINLQPWECRTPRDFGRRKYSPRILKFSLNAATDSPMCSYYLARLDNDKSATVTAQINNFAPRPRREATTGSYKRPLAQLVLTLALLLRSATMEGTF